MQNKSKKPLDQIDSLICRIEKNIAGAMFFLMSIVVLADVIHRVFSRTPGRLAAMLSTTFNTTPESLDPMVDRILVPIVFFLLSYGAIQSRSFALGQKLKPTTIAKRAALGSLAIGLLIIAFIKLIPSGLVWSPYFGLSCLLWLGLLGASIATHHGQHLALEMGEKIWPAHIRPYISKLSSLLVGSFCAFIFVLAFLSVKDHYIDWSSGPEAGLIPSIEWPKWAVYLVVPYSFFMMAFRFISRALGLLSEPTKKDEAEQIQEMISGQEVKS